MIFPTLISLYSSLSTHYYKQSIDHEAGAKFNQRYYKNDDYYKQGGPIILYLGGESALRNTSVTTGLGLRLAKHYNGLLLGLEHRYYGVSQPYKNLKTKNLRYLSSEYALKDIESFINFMNQKLQQKSKWLVLGGSYPGNLSAWSRLKLPNLIHASVASSAPIEAKEDFHWYDEMVSKALVPKCLDYYSEFVRYLDVMYLKPENMERLKEQFGCSDIEDNKMFLYVIADILASIVQYSSPASPFSIENFCSLLTKEPGSDEQMTELISQMYKDYLLSRNQSCYDFSNLEQLSSTKIVPSFNSRQWTYQSCKEFGYWQTAPKNEYRTTRSSYLTKEWFNDFFCGKHFFGKNIGPANVNRTNEMYGGFHFNGTRVIFTNGELDPWSTLSLDDASMSTPEMPILIIKDGSHVNDLKRESPDDLIYVNNTRNEIVKILDSWMLH